MYKCPNVRTLCTQTQIARTVNRSENIQGRIHTGDKIDIDFVASMRDKIDSTVDFVASTGDKVEVDFVASVYAA